MSRCTAPVYGHRTSSGRDACPACSGGGYGRGGYSYGSSYSSSPPSYSPPRSSDSGYGGGGGGGGGGSGGARPRWSRVGSGLSYTTAQVQSLTPIRETVERRAAEQPDLRDVFLCHAWDDRQGSALELHNLLVAAGVKVWFSEKDLGLGVPMMRAIDKGLASSRIGLVLVTPALLARLPNESIADKELSTLLAGNQLVPIVHNTTYAALRNVSPMLASRTGLDTAEDSMAVVAKKIAELVSPSPMAGSA
ncbi:MAG: toll/interleukin-1 receptor domain-containing protein [Pseudomonadota bacterium]